MCIVDGNTGAGFLAFIYACSKITPLSPFFSTPGNKRALSPTWGKGNKLLKITLYCNILKSYDAPLK